MAEKQLEETRLRNTGVVKKFGCTNLQDFLALKCAQFEARGKKF